MVQRQREAQQHRVPSPLLLLLLVCLSFNPVCCFLRGAPGAPHPLKGPLPQLVPWLWHRGPRECNSGLSPLGCSSSSSSSKNEQRECLRCVLLRPKKVAPPVVAGWAEAREALRASAGGGLLSALLPPKKGRPPSVGASISLVAGAPRTAVETVLDVLTVEVGIAPETQRALGLRRSAQKKHLFLPVSLLGSLAVSEETEPRSSLEGPPPVCFQGIQGAPPRLSLLGALKEAACRAADWEGLVGVGAPPLLTARVEIAETRRRVAGQLASQLASQVGPEQLAANQTPEEGDSFVDKASCWTTAPLTSEEEALRVLRGHYEPLLAQYYNQTQSPGSSSSTSEVTLPGTSRGSSCGKGHEWATTLRILRLPRGPRLSLQLQLKPSAPSLCNEGPQPPFTGAYKNAFELPPAPPPLTGAETAEAPLRGKGDPHPTYQLVSLYKFFRVVTPDVLAQLLRALWGPRGVLGRAYVAPEGLNAQLAVPAPVLSSLLEELREVPGLGGGLQVTADCSIPFEAYWERPPFDALHVRPRQQVLRDGFDRALDWDDCGEEVDPHVWHRKLKEALQQQQEQQGKKVVVLDMRNASEFAVGRFKGAECIDTPTFADSFLPGGPLEAALRRAGVRVAQQGASSSDGPTNTSSSSQDVEVMMYCTGGIRCVKAGAYVKQVLGFPRVTRLRGGILAYKNFIRGLASPEPSAPPEAAPPAGAPQHVSHEAQAAAEGTHREASAAASPAAAAAAPAAAGKGEESLFIGSNYVFDHRMCQEVTRDLLASCSTCGGPTGRLTNCSYRQCGRRVALCAFCCSTWGSYCSPACGEKGALEAERERHAQQQRRLQATHTHNRLVRQRGLWALRAQQLLAALKQSAAADSEGASPHPEASSRASLTGEGTPAALEGTPVAPAGQSPWERAHRVAAAASSPSMQQGHLLLQAQQEAEGLTGIRGEGAQFWSGHLQSRILAAISKLKRPRSILEIGAFVGISTLSLAEGLSLEDAAHATKPRLLTIERDPRAASIARRVIAQSPWGPLMQVVEADAMEVLRSFVAAAKLAGSSSDSSSASLVCVTSGNPVLPCMPSGGFDLIYLDAEKRKYSDYIGLILHPQGPVLAPEGVLLIDNTLWRKGEGPLRENEGPPGKGEGPPGEGEKPSTGSCSDDTHERGSSSILGRWARVGEAMEKFRETLRRDPRISHVLLPVGDGLSLVTWAAHSP
ncbi:hypothetical protein Esti_003083 [Eimeria stiedai]